MSTGRHIESRLADEKWSSMVNFLERPFRQHGLEEWKRIPQ
jgi:hypothetical protein